MRKFLLIALSLGLLLCLTIGPASADGPPTNGTTWKVIRDGLEGLRGGEWTRVPLGKTVKVVAQGANNDVMVEWTTATGWTVSAWVQRIFFGVYLTEVAVAAAFLPPPGCGPCVGNECYCCYWSNYYGYVCYWTTVTQN